MNPCDFADIPIEWDDRAVEAAVDHAINAKTVKVRRSSMTLGSYNGFSGETRVAADYKIKVALSLGLIPPPRTCSVCGKSEGRIDYHAENYSRPLQIAPICQGCHLLLHNRSRGGGYTAGWKRRVEQFGDGTKWFEKLV